MVFPQNDADVPLCRDSPSGSKKSAPKRRNDLFARRRIIRPWRWRPFGVRLPRRFARRTTIRARRRPEFAGILLAGTAIAGSTIAMLSIIRSARAWPTFARLRVARFTVAAAARSAVVPHPLQLVVHSVWRQLQEFLPLFLRQAGEELRQIFLRWLRTTAATAEKVGGGGGARPMRSSSSR